MIIEQIPKSHMRLLRDAVLPTLATLMPDGVPQAHPVWCDYKNGHVRVNTAKGRQKDQNLLREPLATLLLVAPDDPYFWIEIRGSVAERIEGDATRKHIDSLAKKYVGAESYTFSNPDEVRVMYKIVPQRVLVSGN